MTDTTTPRLRMPRFLGGQDRTGDVVQFPARVDFNKLFDDIRAAEHAVRTASHEVDRAVLALDETKTVLLARENELTDLRQQWWDESARLGVVLPDDSHG